jgi:hypothetical protein
MFGLPLTGVERQNVYLSTMNMDVGRRISIKSLITMSLLFHIIEFYHRVASIESVPLKPGIQILSG